MGISWKDFELPKKVNAEESTLTETYGKFIAEPFERGFGITVGNSLRRVLLSAIEGYAVTSLKINGALHEFSTIPGVYEDVTQIALNVKQLVLRSSAKGKKIITLKASKEGELQGKDLQTGETIEVVNKDLHLATLTQKTPFEMELTVGRGHGYVPAERNKEEDQPIGVVALDATFSPVTKVNFYVEETRVGQRTDYDRLILEIWTNGAITPKDALCHAATILKRHLDIFVSFGEVIEEEKEEEDRESLELKEKLNQPVSELELSVRSANCLREAKIKTIGDLVKKNEAEMLKYRNFGKKSLAEIIVILEGMGLKLGMGIDFDKLEQMENKEK
ncbi:MAG: DNA-directed RNA polymerase subunit alpha [Candidatus Omnitrophica bacterium]|nr:DNA-directed RNA polymerase subunit alpha [Candidatus Omnitrophota bacterium]